MEKITLKFTNKEWLQLTGIVFKVSQDNDFTDDKYTKAIYSNLLKAVYIKLHNKMHSLKPKNNNLIMSVPEAACLATALNGYGTVNVLLVDIIGKVDRLLT
jgi:hypothetical protein